MIARLKAAFQILIRGIPKPQAPVPLNSLPPDMADISEPEWKRFEEACPWNGRRAMLFWAFVEGVKWARGQAWHGEAELVPAVDPDSEPRIGERRLQELELIHPSDRLWYPGIDGVRKHVWGGHSVRDARAAAGKSLQFFRGKL